MRWTRALFGLLLLATAPAVLSAQVDARMFRYPDVSATDIAFVYAGDIWVVPKEGGVARRLSSPAGEESFPRFSPDGSHIAFSGNYDGNTDVYVIPTGGGTPTRVTYHPGADRLVDWNPDGTRVLFASMRESGRMRYNQLYQAPAGGGIADKLPLPYAEFGAFSPDGSRIAYMPKSRDFRNWKRYRGGWAPDIWLFSLGDSTATNLTRNDANDGQPMWAGDRLYFLSDRGPAQRANLWTLDPATGETSQVTTFTDFDVTLPAVGPEDIVFEAGGDLYRHELASGRTVEVDVKVVTDLATLKPREEEVGSLIQWAGISPTGKRALFTARGDVFTVPAEHGPVLDLTRTSGVAERYAAWSPDGTTLAYWSDGTGEYELTLRPVDGTGAERTVTSLGEGFRYPPSWSPDGRRIAFADEAMRFWVYDVEADDLEQIDSTTVWMGHGGLENMAFNWSADGRWMVYARPVTSSNSAVFLYDTRDGSLHQATSGYFNDLRAVFDPDGAYLYYLSNRNFEPVYSDFDNSWTYPNATRVVAVPLRSDVPSALAPRNDTEPVAGEEDGGEEADTASAPVEITLDGFEARGTVLPPEPGNYSDLAAVKGKVILHRHPRTGAGEGDSPIVYYDLADREEKTVVADADAFALSADGKKLLVLARPRWAIVDVAPDQKMETPLRTAEMTMEVDPRAEWHQIFTDVYRIERDYFYDAGMHGVDWDGLRDRYGSLIDESVTRWDVNWVIGQFIAELSSSHTYNGGGDLESAPSRPVGLLGADLTLENGAFRIGHIVEAAPWDDVHAPLAEPGVDVREGDYLLAVNRVPLDTSTSPLAAFEGLGEAPLLLTVNDSPDMDGAREVLVEPLGSDTDLRFAEWIEARRRIVDEATDGRVGYIYVQSTGVDAQSELLRQFMAQWQKDGLIIDERWNSGGQIPDRFIELLNRPMLAFWAVRHGESWQWPPVAHVGPMAMLINGWSGSGGDAFPFYFKEMELGPLIGERTWGGLIGISGAPELIDGGTVTVPTFRMYDPEGTWFPEGYGVEPDIAVVDDPAQLVRGHDPQLERAIAEVMEALEASPELRPQRPPRMRR